MIKRITDENEMSIFLSDESRRSGVAREICFPQTADEIIALLQEDNNTPVTVQGGRTGVTAGAVPEGGIAINLSGMNRVLSMPETVDSGSTVLTAVVEPGLALTTLQEQLHARGLFFPPDPTEISASIGGMVSCNSSGACSYRYGATRDHIRSLEMVLADGDTLSLRRGDHHAKAGKFILATGGGREISGTLPPVSMPDVRKHTAGYFIRPDMDMIDLFIGSEGTLGIVTRIEIDLMPEPENLWGAVVFFHLEEEALGFVHLLREEGPSEAAGLPLHPQAIEFFGTDTVGMLREAQRSGSALTDMAEIPAGCAVYTEYASADRSELEPLFSGLGRLITEAGGNPAVSWFAFRGPDMLRLKEFRHAAPVCVNELVSEMRQSYPAITKLGTDMSVPDARLDEVFAMYRGDLAKEGFRTSLFGHIGNNHLHCNIIPRNDEEYMRGKELYTGWAEEVVRMGGSVSAEHGIGKLKTWLLRKLYTEEELAAMFELKRLFDPQLRLNPGNIFGYNE
ncbi:MAG: FAD-binding oxidoreductase [Bacillota bacterium]